MRGPISLALLARLREGLASRYDVEGAIASGGMSHVYRGFDRSLQRPVAIKVLRPELATARAAERFHREARLLARLSHPNIVSVHEVGEAAGLFYYVMDLVAGDTLRERLARGPLPAADAVRVGMDVLRALGAAHADGVVHRDLKPSNVFLAGDRALLADFGVARTRTGSGEALTELGERPGTPGYMAPEQALGDEATALSDLYAVGMLLYESLTGRRWSAIEDARTADWSGVPAEIAGVLRRALARRAEDRWPDARAFRSALVAASASRAVPRPVVLALVILGLGAASAGAALLLGRTTAEQAARANPEPARIYDLAFLPCETVPASDSATGEALARLAYLGLEGLPMVSLAPFNTTARRWRAARETEDDVAPGSVAEALRARRVVRCVLLAGRADSLREVRLELLDREGVSLPLRTLRGHDIGGSYELGDSVAVEILRAILPERALTAASLSSLSGHDVQAVGAFLSGEHAFLRNDRHRAARYYEAALDRDPELVIAHWRLADVRRWLAEPPGVDLRELHTRHAEALPRMERLMLEAALSEPGPEKFARLEEVLHLFPHDAYAALIYGDELFHRGPLWGIPPDSAIRVLRAATELDPYLAPAWEHLLYAETRLGRREPAEDALRRYRELVAAATSPPPLDLFHPDVLELAFLERFEPERARAVRVALFAGGVPGGREVLTAGARFSGPYLDSPATQLELGLLLASGNVTPAQRVTAQVTQAVALLVLGRAQEALSRLDSAATRFADPAGVVQAAEWRTIPAALGLPAPSVEESETARESLREVAWRQGHLRATRTRAAFALALVAAAGGDEAGYARWRSFVAEDSVTAGSLPRIVDAFRAAARGDPEGAAIALRPFAIVDSVDRVRYPFARAAVHLARGEWLLEQGLADSALAVWRWYEATDLEDRIVGPSLRTGEVDWAVSTHARARAARAALAAGRPAEACALAEEALRRWERADEGLRPWIEEVSATRSEACAAARARRPS